MKPIWISTSKVSELLKISERHVRNRLSLWEYKWEEENGRKVLKINARSLPKEACDRYILETLPEVEEVQAVAPTQEDIESTNRAYERATSRSKKNFDKWSVILSKCEGIQL